VITYLVSSFQKAPYIGSVLESIRLDRIGIPSEVIILDDGSRDGSFDIVLDFARRNEGVTALAQENRGIFHVMNRLLPMARMPWIRLVDSDDPLVPGSSATLIEAAQRLKAAYAFGEAVKYGPKPLYAGALKPMSAAIPKASVLRDPIAYALRGFRTIPSTTLIARPALDDVVPLPDLRSCQDLAIALALFPRHRVASIAATVCHQLVGIRERLSANETLTFHQTLRVIQHYGARSLDTPHRAMALVKSLSRSMRWMRENQRPIDLSSFLSLKRLQVGAKLGWSLDWDRTLDAAAAPLEAALSDVLARQTLY
jgi:hypothetical protein